MKTGNQVCRGVAVFAAALIVGLACGVQRADAQGTLIRYRPLTPQEIVDFGLTNTTQKSGGAPNAGIGQPVYVEVLVTNGTVVNAINWSLYTSPPGSTAVIEVPGPLSNSVPTYDGGDRIGRYVAGRAVFKPDVTANYIITSPASNSYFQDHKIKTELVLTNKTVAYTNSVYGSLYMGSKYFLCQLCHVGKQADFALTDHATAFERQITGVGSSHFSSNCISCHTLGYDKTAGANNEGFDDVAASVGWTFPGSLSPTNWSGMDTNLQNKANVQCENCHGPASSHIFSGGKTNAIDVTLSAGTCGQCHDSLPHHVKAYEWGQALHATGYVFRFSGSCIPCHSAAGFIETWDPYYAPSNKTPRATAQEGIACAACHDPHTVGMGEHQLRNIPTAALSNGTIITSAEAGTGVLCINCHHSRQEANAAVLGTPSPHHGTQGDMLKGQNGYEYGLDMPSSRHMTAVTNSCVGCHMQLVAGTSFSNANTKVGGHTFKLSWDAGTPSPTDDVHVTEVCSVCHVESGTFNFGGEDYDRNGTVDGVQTEISNMLSRLEQILPPAGTNVVVDGSYTPAMKKAAWNYLFVREDRSHGVHNPKYASALLWASLQDLAGGIDQDLDGLVDTWEIANFGSLTAQTGSGDADGDGVSNKLEEDLGLNPNLADSDLDTLSDLAELEGGSNPLDIGSTLPTNAVSVILPAMELGYLPGQVGVTQVFQAVNVMGDSGGWTNVGPSFISSNSLTYQLISLRDSTQKYFRVTKP